MRYDSDFEYAIEDEIDGPSCAETVARRCEFGYPCKSFPSISRSFTLLTLRKERERKKGEGGEGMRGWRRKEGRRTLSFQPSDSSIQQRSRLRSRTDVSTDPLHQIKLASGIKRIGGNSIAVKVLGYCNIVPSQFALHGIENRERRTDRKLRSHFGRNHQREAATGLIEINSG